MRHARAIRPALPVLVISGYAAAVRAIGLLGVHILEKPFTRSELLEAIALAQSIDLSLRCLDRRIDSLAGRAGTQAVQPAPPSGDLESGPWGS